MASQNSYTNSVLVASSAIRTKKYTVRRLPSKMGHVRPRHFRKMGKEIEVIVDNISSRDHGIAIILSHPILVPKVTVEERLKVKIPAIKRRFSFAEKIESKRRKSFEN